ncbi:MAG: hypothetical protein ACKVQQ_06345 [Burkholderiales bacterium]
MTPPSTSAAPRHWLARLLPGLFAIPLGLLGLAGAWQRLVPLGITMGNPLSLWLTGGALAILVLLACLWMAKLIAYPAIVRAEWQHPVQGPLLALLPVAVLLAVTLLAPAFSALAMLWLGLTLAALAMQAVAAWQVVGKLSTGQIPEAMVTPAFYLPTVAGGLVGALALNAQGMAGWAALLFGMGLGAWGLLEIRILNRLFSGPLPAPLRPLIGLEMAPAAIGGMAAASLWPELPADVLMVFLGVASGPTLAILTRWRYWSEISFAPGFWSFSFPVAAMASVAVEGVRRGDWPDTVALTAVGIASLVIAYLAVRTLLLLARGRLLPPA